MSSDDMIDYAWLESKDDERRSTHIVIPDTQIKPGAPTDHLEWIGRYIVDKYAGKPDVTLVHLGDHWDMPSLSSYDKGKKAMEGRRYLADIKAGNDGFTLLNQALLDYNARRVASKHGPWKPRRVFITGNHEDRISRAINCDAQLEGLLSLDDLNAASLGWEVYPFLQPVFVDGVCYVHFLSNSMTGRPLGGMALNRLKQVGHSFTMGHQQTLDYATRPVRDTRGITRMQNGLVAGACYLHYEDYKNPQGNAHWRGIIICNEVNNGSYDPMFVSLDYLCKRYEGTGLRNFMISKYGG